VTACCCICTPSADVRSGCREQVQCRFSGWYSAAGRNRHWATGGTGSLYDERAVARRAWRPRPCARLALLLNRTTNQPRTLTPSTGRNPAAGPAQTTPRPLQRPRTGTRPHRRRLHGPNRQVPTGPTSRLVRRSRWSFINRIAANPSHRVAAAGGDEHEPRAATSRQDRRAPPGPARRARPPIPRSASRGNAVLVVLSMCRSGSHFRGSRRETEVRRGEAPRELEALASLRRPLRRARVSSVTSRRYVPRGFAEAAHARRGEQRATGSGSPRTADGPRQRPWSSEAGTSEAGLTWWVSAG
jgi:hypothetical protein